jgi:hypothetical protein
MFNHWARSYLRRPGKGFAGNTIKAAAACSAYLVFSSTASIASSLGMVADNATDELRLFDVETGTVIASLKGSASRISGDCALSEDQVTGFSSHANQHIAVYQLSMDLGEPAIGVSDIEISNIGVDMSLSPDGSLLVSVGAGNTYEPLSIVDTQRKTEIAVAAPFLDHTSAEFCDDGTLLVTTTYGHSHVRPFDNALYDARVSRSGEFQLAGNRLSSGAQPNNASCAPGSRAGVLLDRDGGLTSFTLPGLNKADYAALHGATAVAAVFNHAGDRLYVRTSAEVIAFDYNPLNGVMQLDWVQPVSFSAEYFGIDQIAVDPDNGRIYVDGGQSLLILDPDKGRQLGAISAGDATGVCFAHRQRHTPIVDVAAIDRHAATVTPEILQVDTAD